MGMQDEENQVIETDPETEQQREEVDDDDDGPPPGFQCIINPQPPPSAIDDADDDDGPPPGFDSIVPKPSPPLHSSSPSDMEKSGKQDDIDDDDEDDEGPPPGWEFSALANALPNPISNTTDIKAESNEDLSNDDLDEGPPPGWETVLPNQMPRPRTPPLQSSSPVSSRFLASLMESQGESINQSVSDCEGTEIESKPEIESTQEITKNDDEVPPSVPECKPTPEHSSPPTPPLQQPTVEVPSDAGNKGKEKKVRIKRPTTGNQLASPQQQLPTNPRPLAPAPAQSSSSEKAQLVCGKCRKLCVYPRGSKWVQCPSCQEVNFVLEAHEVGQVECGKCAVLLMYPHGAPAVQCTSCHFVTEIGAHNRRPPLSVQQAQRRGRRSNRFR